VLVPALRVRQEVGAGRQVDDRQDQITAGVCQGVVAGDSFTAGPLAAARKKVLDRRSAPALTAQAVTIAGAAGDADACWPRPARPCSALTSAVNALAAAARAFHLALTRLRPSRAGGSVTGIDYLGSVTERHRRQLLHGLRLADPTSAAGDRSPWQTINVLTAGRLLTTRTG
jgi:hypothetical protein